MDIKNDFATGLVSHWKLEEASGTRVDSHGSNDLTDNNTVLSATGIQGDGADFESANSEYLSIAHASQTGLNTPSDFSCSFWLKLETLPSLDGSGGGTIVSKYDGGGNREGFILYFLSTGDRLYFQYWCGSGTSSTANYFAGAVDADDVGNWVHFLVVADLSAKTLSTWKDGVSLGSPTSAGTSCGSIASSPNGAFVVGSNAGSGQYIDGVVDELSIWDGLLDGTDATNLYNSGDGIPYEDTGGGSSASSSPSPSPSASVSSSPSPSVSASASSSPSPSVSSSVSSSPSTSSSPSPSVSASVSSSPSASSSPSPSVSASVSSSPSPSSSPSVSVSSSPSPSASSSVSSSPSESASPSSSPSAGSSISSSPSPSVSASVSSSPSVSVSSSPSPSVSSSVSSSPSASSSPSSSVSTSPSASSSPSASPSPATWVPVNKSATPTWTPVAKS